MTSPSFSLCTCRELQPRSLAVLPPAVELPESVKIFFSSPLPHQRLTHSTQPLILYSGQTASRERPRLFTPPRNVALTHVTRPCGRGSSAFHLAIHSAVSSGGENRAGRIKFNSRLWNTSWPHYSEGCQSNPSAGAECRRAHCAVTQD